MLERSDGRIHRDSHLSGFLNLLNQLDGQTLHQHCLCTASIALLNPLQEPIDRLVVEIGKLAKRIRPLYDPFAD